MKRRNHRWRTPAHGSGTALATAAALLLLPGCYDAAPLTESRAYGPRAVGAAVMLDDPSGGAVWVVAPPSGDAAPTPIRRVAEGSRIAEVLTRDGEARFLLLADSDTHRIVRVAEDAATAATAALAAVETDVPFSALRACEDGAAALAFHKEGANAATLVNTAEVGLATPGGSGLVRATVSGLGRAPYDAGCTAALPLADGDHRLAWVVARSVIGLVDIGPGGSGSVVVPLVAPNSSSTVLPSQVIARSEADGVHLYVIAQGSKDVLHLRVALGGDVPAVSLDQIGVGGSPIALELIGEGATLRAVTLNAGPASVSLVDPGTGAALTYGLDAAADRWLTYDTPDGGREAVAYAGQSQAASVSRIALTALAKKKGKAIQTLKAEAGVASVQRAGELLLFGHGAVDGISIYNRKDDKISTFKGTGAVVATVARPDAVYVLGTRTDRWPQTSRLSRIDVQSLAGSATELDVAATSLLPFGSQGVVASGPGVGGTWLLIWPDGTGAADPPSFWLEGFALAGALEKEVP